MSETNIDWNLIKNLDPAQIKHNKDSKSIYAIIKSIGSSYISLDDLGVFTNNPLTPRLIQLLQLAIEYLMLFQKHLSKNLESKNNEYSKLKKKFQQVLEINENLRKPREVCPTCGKKFKIGYLDQHFRLRHPDLIEPWIQIRAKSTIARSNEDKAIIEEISAIQKAKERNNKFEINKCNSVQISPIKKTKDESNEQKSQLQSEEQISLNQRQLNQMVDEISKRISEHIQLNKDSCNTDSVDVKNTRNNQNNNSNQTRQMQQFNIDARLHDQSQNYQDYIQYNTTSELGEAEYNRQNRAKNNQYISPIKKNSGNRVVFDPTAIENHTDSRRKNKDRNLYDNNDYDYDYNDENANDENYNPPQKYEKSNQINQDFQDQKISANELDDFIMGSSDVAISNQQTKSKQQQNQIPLEQNQPNRQQKASNQQQRQEKPKSNQPQIKQQLPNIKQNYDDNTNANNNDFDDFMMGSSEMVTPINQSKNPPKPQQQQPKQLKQQEQPIPANDSQYQKNNEENQNDGDYKDEFDEFMVDSSEIDQTRSSSKPKQQSQSQNTKQPNQQQPKQVQQMQQQYPKQTQRQSKPIQQQQPKQIQQQQLKQKQMSKQQYQLAQSNSSPYQMKNSDNQSAETYHDGLDDFMMGSSEVATSNIQDSNKKYSQKVQRQFKDSPQSPKNISYFPSSASFSPNASPPPPSSSSSFPPSPSSFSPAIRKQRRQQQQQQQQQKQQQNPSNSEFEFTDEKPPLKELPKPPKRDVTANGQSNYVTFTNNELDDLIQESSSILNEETKSKPNKNTKSKKNNVKNTFSTKQTTFTNSDLDALIQESSSLLEEKKKTQNQQKQSTKQTFKNNNKDIFYENEIPSQFEKYSPSELEVILAEESSVMDNKLAPKSKHNAKPKSNYRDEDEYYYDQGPQSVNNSSYRGDFYDDYPNENTFDDKYDYPNDSRSNNFSNPTISSQKFKANDYSNYNSDFYDDNNVNDSQYRSFNNYDKYGNEDINTTKQQPVQQEKINKPPLSIAEARKMAKKKKKSQQITTIGGVEFTDSQLAGFL
ncbi:hypothetical protein M9Y10_004997 [Tritrichomonas musculus]|uniref:Cilium assembly protein DZIP1 N-terminal domain-containing protein n=1 Tax=Tritrichomonas musculus TaxID=1915356 RepID=A0ABR2JK15_9EUKA